MADIVAGVVARGQGIAGRELFGPNREHYESILGPIHPASLNVRIDRVISTWPRWEVGPGQFNEHSKRVPCKVDEVPGFVLWVEHPAPSYREGRPSGITYPDKTMLEIVCTACVPGVEYGVEVRIEVELSAL